MLSIMVDGCGWFTKLVIHIPNNEKPISVPSELTRVLVLIRLNPQIDSIFFYCTLRQELQYSLL
jgi:hypothetical protein